MVYKNKLSTKKKSKGRKLMTTDRTRIDAKKLIKFLTNALQRLGVPEEDAQISARVLVATSLRGVDSHGITHPILNIKGLKTGRINAKPQVKVFSYAPSTATMEGDQGLGYVVGYRAMIEAIHRAEKTGAGFITVRNTASFGAGAYYAMMALEHDMIGMAMTSYATTPDVVAPGSAKAAVGTNPLAVAAPAGKKPPFVLDMATSVVAEGKLEIAQRKGTSIPEGWAIDKEGKPITDPTKRLRGEVSLLPLGGTPTLGSYKGFGLGVLLEILCGVLSGSSASILRTPGIRSVDHFFGALRIDSFLPVENFTKSMDEMIEAFEALPKLPGVKKIYVAGGYEAEIEKDRKANGIPLNSKVIEELQELAKEVGIEYDLWPKNMCHQ